MHTVEPAPGVLHFGPYLGGLRVRLAVSALQRVFPLAYSAEGVRGSMRDMARVRGVDPADREGIIAAIIAVLQRDAEAVASLRERLVRRRDQAAAALAFELAGRLVVECEAVDWVVSEQRAALAEPRDFDVYGFAEGVLVELRVRTGRLCGWTQRPCTEAAARKRLEVTPPDWTGFARRNAHLAVRLGRTETWP